MKIKKWLEIRKERKVRWKQRKYNEKERKWKNEKVEINDHKRKKKWSKY